MYTCSTQVGAREGNFKKIINMQFMAIKTKARTVVVIVGTGEECLPCYSQDMSLQKGGGLTKLWTKKLKYAQMGQKKE